MTRSILPPGKVRVKTGGGSAGNNGIRSIDAHIGTEYHRVRLGVGKLERQGHGACACAGRFRQGRPALARAADRRRSPRMRPCSRRMISRRSRTRCIWRSTPKPRRRSPRKRRQTDGFQMRHRRTAQCRQIDLVQRPDPNGGGAGGELSLLHDRAQCRRCRRSR